MYNCGFGRFPFENSFEKEKNFLDKYRYSLQHIFKQSLQCSVQLPFRVGCPYGLVALMGSCPYGLVALVGGNVLRVGGPG